MLYESSQILGMKNLTKPNFGVLFITKIINLLFNIFFLFLISYPPTRIAEEKKNAGNNEYKARNYRTALKLYSDAITLCPSVPSYYGNRAACYLMLGECKAAIADSKKSISLDDKFEKGYVRIAKCLIMLGDIVGAEQIIKKYQTIVPKSTALNLEIQNCKTLRDLQDKGNASYEKKDFRTTVYYMNSALKIADKCQR